MAYFSKPFQRAYEFIFYIKNYPFCANLKFKSNHFSKVLIAMSDYLCENLLIFETSFSKNINDFIGNFDQIWGILTIEIWTHVT